MVIDGTIMGDEKISPEMSGGCRIERGCIMIIPMDLDMDI